MTGARDRPLWEQGRDGRLTEPSARAEMTIPSEDRDLLIILASSSTVPSAPVFPTFETQVAQESSHDIAGTRPSQTVKKRRLIMERLKKEKHIIGFTGA